MAHPDKERRKERRHSISNNQAIAATIAAVGTIGAAFVTGAFQGHSLGLGPKPAVTVTEKVTVTPGPAAGAVSASAAARQSQPSPSSNVPLLTPKNEPGWTLAWQGALTIGPQGVLLAHTGPQVGDGSNFDLQYVPANDIGWRKSGNAGDFDYWFYTYKPGPATIYGDMISGAFSKNPIGTQANVGDRLCYDSEQGDLIGYMQVTAVGPANITVEGWLWTKS